VVAIATVVTTHPNSKFLGWLWTACYWHSNKRVGKQLWACVKAERLLFGHYFWHCTLFR